MQRQADLRSHITLVKNEYLRQANNIPREAQEPWAYLMAEAMRNAELRGIEATHRMVFLDMLWETSNSVDGWKADKLVDAMTGEEPPATVPAAAFLTTPMPNGERNGEDKNRRGLIGRLRK